MKAVKIFLFFWDFGVRYVRFWSRLFAYFNPPKGVAGKRREELSH